MYSRKALMWLYSFKNVSFHRNFNGRRQSTSLTWFREKIQNISNNIEGSLVSKSFAGKNWLHRELQSPWVRPLIFLYLIRVYIHDFRSFLHKNDYAPLIKTPLINPPNQITAVLLCLLWFMITHLIIEQLFFRIKCL